MAGAHRGSMPHRVPAGGEVARVFVSHASEDQLVAARLHGWLVDDGHEVFLDRDLRDGIAVGEVWEQRLYERLRWADAVVCLITSAYRGSAWCTAEVGIAGSLGSRLLPVLAEPGQMHPLLPSSRYQYTDLAGDPDAARAAMGEALRRVDAAGGLGWADDRSPFPGLQPFEDDLHRVFFGRHAEVEALASLLRSPAGVAGGGVLLVVGPSGCGKSSLVRAGLSPVMAAERDWSTLPPLVPGADPVAALAHELAAGRAAVGAGLDAAAGARSAKPRRRARPAGRGAAAGRPRRRSSAPAAGRGGSVRGAPHPDGSGGPLAIRRAAEPGAGGTGSGGGDAARGVPGPAAGQPAAGRPADPALPVAAVAPGGADVGHRGTCPAGWDRGGRRTGGHPGRRHRHRGGAAAAGVHPRPARRRRGPRRPALTSAL